MSTLRDRNLYQDVTADIKFLGLKAKTFVFFILWMIPWMLLVTFVFAGISGGFQMLGYLVIGLVYLVLLIDIKAIRSKNRQNRKDKKNASPDQFMDLKEIDVVSKDSAGNSVAFTTNTVLPWELATAEQKEAAATEWASQITEIVCHRSGRASLFAFTHLENDTYLERKYEASFDEDESTRHFTQARVSHHAALRNASMAVTYINRVTKLDDFDDDYDIEELVSLLPGARLGGNAIKALAGHLSPNARRERGK